MTTPRRSEPLPPRLGERFVLELPAHASCLHTLRRRMRAWLAAAGWPAGEADDLVHAVSEAASNAVEHAYPPAGAAQTRGRRRAVPKLRVGAEVLRAAGGGFCVEARVRDWGRWRPAAATPGYRGRGLAMIRSSMQDVTIRSDATGTEIVLLSARVARLVPERARPWRGPVPLRVRAVEVTAPAATMQVADWRAAWRPLAARAEEAIARAAAVQGRSAEHRRSAEVLLAVARERRREG